MPHKYISTSSGSSACLSDSPMPTLPPSSPVLRTEAVLPSPCQRRFDVGSGPAEALVQSGAYPCCRLGEALHASPEVFLMDEEEAARLPPWQRMRGGGGAQSSDAAAGGTNGSFSGKQRRAAGPSSSSFAAPSTRSGDYTGRGSNSLDRTGGVGRAAAPVGGGGSGVSPSKKLVYVAPAESSSESASMSGAPSPGPGPLGAPSASRAAAQTSPETPFLQRPVLTIFTTVDEDEDEEEVVEGGAGASGTFRAQPTATIPPRSEGQALRATETSLLPVDHLSLFGNGLEPSFPNSPSPQPMLRPAMSNPSFVDGRSRCGPTPPESPGIPGFSTQGLAAFTGTPPEAAASLGSTTAGPRVSATPVVPIAPYNEAAKRRRLAENILSRYGPNAPKVVEEPIVLPSTAPATKADEKEAERQRKLREKEEAKLKKKHKGSTTAASAPPKPPPMTREQIIRVGAMRLLQRLSALHLTVYRVKNDGNCQFRAIAYQLLGSEDYHDIIRAHVVSYMRRVRVEKFDFYFDSPAAADTYFDKLEKMGAWGDELSLRGASDALFINIHILSSSERNCYSCYQPSEDAPPAPTFLVDVARIKERRRRERQFVRWQKKSFSQARGLSMASAQSMPAHHPDPLSPPRSAASSHWDAHATNLSTQATAGSTTNGKGSRGATPSVSRVPGDDALTSMSCPDGVLMSVGTKGAAGSVNAEHVAGTATAAGPLLYPALTRLSDHGSDSDADEAAGLDKDGEQVDAMAIQQALQKKLERTRIRTSVPFFTPDGQLRQPTARPSGALTTAGSFTVTTPQSFGGFGASPLNPSTAAAASVGGGHSFQVTSTLSNTTTPRASAGPLLVPQGRTATASKDAPHPLNGPLSGSFPPPGASGSAGAYTSAPQGISSSAANEVGAVMPPYAGAAGGGPTSAVGPDITASCNGPDGCAEARKPVMGLANFGVTSNDAVNITRYQSLRRPPARLLRPAVEAVPSGTSQQHPQQQATTVPLSQSFPIFPTVDGGNVMLLATPSPSAKQLQPQRTSRSSSTRTAPAHRALNQSFAALRSGAGQSHSLASQGQAGQSFSWQPTSNAGSLWEGSSVRYRDGGASDSDGETHNEDEVVFVFEPRHEPIDVFLSYLYPVHYNALCVVEPDSDAEDSSQAERNAPLTISPGAATTGTLLQPQGSFTGPVERPQFINASFLRPSTSM